MNELANTLRMYAEDMHSRTGFNYISRTMSQAADRLEELEKERDSLVSALDTEMVVTCLGTYSSGQDPRNALNKLMAWSESVGAYFAQDKIKELEKERDKLILAVADHATARCELAAQNVAMREALNTVLDAVIALEVEQSDYLLRSSVVLKATDALNLPDIASEVLKRRDADTGGSADRLEVLEREHAEFFDRWHGERRRREKLVDDVDRCYRMLLSEPNTKGALFKAENILREALADAKAATHNTGTTERGEKI